MADRPTISLIIPTVSRPTLARTLASVRKQDWYDDDEVLLVGDGPQPVARALWQQYGLPGRYLETPSCFGFWGHGVRNWVLAGRVATGTHLMALDDDDELTADAVKVVRAAVSEAPDRPHIFRMSGVPNGIGTVWQDKEIRERNVGTPTGVFPNDPTKLARFAPRYGGDYDFIATTAAMFPPNSVVWREEVICRVRPWRS